MKSEIKCIFSFLLTIAITPRFLNSSCINADLILVKAIIRMLLYLRAMVSKTARPISSSVKTSETKKSTSFSSKNSNKVPVSVNLPTILISPIWSK